MRPAKEAAVESCYSVAFEALQTTRLEMRDPPVEFLVRGTEQRAGVLRFLTDFRLQLRSDGLDLLLKRLMAFCE